MKSFKLIIFILVIFLKTGNVLSDENIFHVNNVKISNKKFNKKDLSANQAIRAGFKELINRILLQEDKKKLSNLNLKDIKNLVTYYQITNKNKKEIEDNLAYNIQFDKEKLHDLFYRLNISYADISNQEIYILPILKKQNQNYIFNQNYFYSSWSSSKSNELLQFVLPLENIEIIQKVNSNQQDLLGLNLNDIFREYKENNLALVIIEDNGFNKEKIFLKTKISGKNISKNIIVERLKLTREEFYKKIIVLVQREILNLVKSRNLIDIRTPSFLNVKFNLDKKNNLVILNSTLKNIDSIENIFVQELNNDHVLLKIKYLGKLNKIIRQLKNKDIILEQVSDQWSLKII